jgi:hypothetical protein
MNFAEYAALPRVNWSTLKAAKRSPKHYQHRLAHPIDDTPRLGFGRAVHTAVLEPDRLALDYVVFFGERRAGKEWAAFCEQHPDQTILKRDEYESCLAVRDAVRAHPVAAALLRSGEAEQTILWTDTETGIECKARIDWLGAAGLVDLKTTADVDARLFGATAARLRANGIDVPAKIIAVETEAPCDVAVFGIDDDVLYAGEVEVTTLLRRVAECRERDEWPGRYVGEEPLRLPAWAFPAENEVDQGLDLLVSASEA